MKRYFSTEQTFSKIYLCESLPHSESSTGIRLAQGTLKLLCDINGIYMDACKIRDKRSFLAFMRRIELEAREQRVFPIIHLEIHGDKCGLQLSSGERFKWGEFSDTCRMINQHCSNNLLVILAVCHGFDVVCRTSITKLTPFFSLIGPTDTVCVGQIERDFPKFYSELLDSGDLISASSLLGKPYQLYLCEQVFAKSVVRYIKQYCRGKGRQERVEELLTKFKRSPGGHLITTGNTRKLIKELIEPNECQLERFRAKFLMAHEPKNEGRFTLGVDKLIELAYTE